MTKQFLFIMISLSLSFFWAVDSALADDTATDGDIENLFSKQDDTASIQAIKASGAGSSSEKTSNPDKRTEDVDADRSQPLKELSDLGRLQSFSDTAVIQRRFLPKSGRFEFHIAPALNLNDAFFFSVGGTARFGYYFVERYGLELTAVYLSTSTRQVTDSLYQRGVLTSSFVSPQGFYGLDFKWIPIYGKMTWANRKITNFDFYFSLGGGITPTNQNTSEATLHLGTGQVFALSKSGAVRWDLSWFMFTSRSALDTSGNRSLYHNVLFSIGWSWFFPEAKYR